MKRRQFTLAAMILAITILVVSFLASVTAIPTYDPWYDTNLDGKIDIKDVAAVARLFGAVAGPGETFGALAGLTYDSGWLDISDMAGQYFNITHDLNNMDLVVEITGKTSPDGGSHQRNYGGTGYIRGWSKAFGGSDEDDGWSIVQASDRGYAILGATNSTGAGKWDVWLIKTDEWGNVQWDETYGGANSEYGMSIVSANDGGYVIASHSNSFGAGAYDLWLIKTDAFGNLEWSTTCGGVNDDIGRSIVATDDGGYAIAGRTGSFGDPNFDMWLVKADEWGNIQWNRTYGGNEFDMAYSMVETHDSKFVLSGTTLSFGAGERDFWLVKTNSTGHMEWNKTYGGVENDYGQSVCCTSEGDYVLTGYTNSSGAGSWDFWLIRIDPSGNMVWNKTYGGVGSDAARSVIQTSEGGFAVGGHTTSWGAGSNDFYLIKTDSYGNVLWNRTYGGSSLDRAYATIQTYDGGFVMVGQTESFGVGNSDFWLVRVDMDVGLTWTDSTANTIILFRGETDSYWNYVRVRIWKVKETP